MPRWATLSICLAVAGVFASVVPLAHLFNLFTPLLSTLSIMAAGLLVRLNRTMPTLEWKSIESEARKNLTAEIVGLTREYMVILGVTAALLVFILALMLVGADAVVGSKIQIALGASGWPMFAQRISCGLIGGLISLVFSRMAYVIWRDYDIVKLQRVVILAAAEKSEREAAGVRAEETRALAAKANLRAVPLSPPKAWGE